MDLHGTVHGRTRQSTQEITKLTLRNVWIAWVCIAVSSPYNASAYEPAGGSVNYHARSHPGSAKRPHSAHARSSKLKSAWGETPREESDGEDANYRVLIDESQVRLWLRFWDDTHYARLLHVL